MPATRPTASPPAIRRATIPILVYGTKWCAHTQMVRRFLDRQGVSYIYCDMDDDKEAAQQVYWWSGGYYSHPTVQIGGNILVEPSLDEVRLALKQLSLI
jgi:mycoredoxin